MRIAIERIAGPSARRVPFRRAAGGKPQLPGVAFSLSHAGGRALIGVTRARSIGVDLEVARAVRMPARRREELIAAGAGLASEPLPAADGDAAFLQAWSRLEACAKARGDGLAATLAELGLRGVDAAQRTATPLAVVEARAAALARRAGLRITDIALPAGLHAAAALTRSARLTPPRAFPTTRRAIEALPRPPANHR